MYQNTRIRRHLIFQKSNMFGICFYQSQDQSQLDSQSQSQLISHMETRVQDRPLFRISEFQGNQSNAPRKSCEHTMEVVSESIGNPVRIIGNYMGMQRKSCLNTKEILLEFIGNPIRVQKIYCHDSQEILSESRENPIRIPRKSFENI